VDVQRPRDQSNSRILSLPAEIRIQIDNFVVADKYWVSAEMRVYHQSCAKRRSIPHPLPALSRACQQLQAETEPIYFGETCFYIADKFAFTLWRNGLGSKSYSERRISLFRHIKLKVELEQKETYPFACLIDVGLSRDGSTLTIRCTSDLRPAIRHFEKYCGILLARRPEQKFDGKGIMKFVQDNYVSSGELRVLRFIPGPPSSWTKTAT